MQKIALILLFSLLVCLAGCTKPRPAHIGNVCAIFRQYPSWYRVARRTEKKWGVPISVQMAIIYQESHFNARAKPPRKKWLWVFPGRRISSAYGYSQALKHTWWQYEHETGHHRSRATFRAATDFIGWYSHLAHTKLGIRPSNAYRLYLAYHEGITGYSRRRYFRKPWLIRVAHSVAYRAAVYRRQLVHCR